MSLYSDDLTIRHEEEDDWRDTGLIAGVLVGLGFVLFVVEICRLPGRVWRWMR